MHESEGEMSKRAVISLIAIAVILLAGAGAAFAASYYADLPNRLSQHETILLGQSRVAPGSQPVFRVLVRDSSDGEPIPDAEVMVSLRPAEGGETLEVFTGRTDGQGSAEVSFKLPGDLSAQQVLKVETRSKLGADTLERDLQVERDYRVLLTSDKPIYQPGQLIHLRALALSAFDLIPAADQEIQFVIADGKGNKVFRRTLMTDEYGVTSVDFTLASEVNTGAYKISATLGNTTSEKTVTVEHYVLPKFDVTIETERSYYLPGERISGSLSAQYFFGKPVAGGQVQLEGYTFDFQKQVTITLQGETDEEGNFNFEFDLPAYIAGSDLEGGLGRFYIQASVTDLAQHTEISNTSLPVAGSALVIDAVPEGGVFRPGVENILYVLTSYPDGMPAAAKVNVVLYDNNTTLQAETGEYGLAEIRFTPSSPYLYLNIEARDQLGNTARRDFNFEGQWSEETVLLRPHQPVYQIGQTMQLDLLTSAASGTVYLDIIRDGQTLSTRSVKVENNRAQVSVDVTPDMFGTLELHAYKILRSGAIARDTRLVVVDQASDLIINLQTGQESYLPGETADLNLQVAGDDGAGVQSAVGLAIVDESVFALAEQDPGFAKLYFMLEAELLQPKYDLHGLTFPDLMSGMPSDDIDLKEAVADVAQASLASAVAGKGMASPFSLQANSHQDAVDRAVERQQAFFAGMSKTILALLIILPLALLILSGYTLWKNKSLGGALLIVFALLSFLAALFFAWPTGENAPWVDTPLEKLGWIFDQINYSNSAFPLILILAGLAGLLGTIVTAILRKDTALGWLLIGAVMTVALLIGLVFALSNSRQSAPERVLIIGFVALCLIPLSMLLRSAGFFWRGAILPGLGALLAASLMLVTLPLAVVFGGTRGAMAPGARDFGGPMVVEEAGIMPPMPLAAMPTQSAAVEKDAAGNETQSISASQPPRLRQYFPETMLWLPDAVTDGQGSLSLEIPIADSITTWRMTVLASSQDGRIGATSAGLRVFQDFFVDLDLPVALTVDDEISVPVGVFNYLTEAQTVRLELEQGEWFELLDEPVKEIEIAANDITVVYFRIRALDFGQQVFKVTAWGSRMSDAIQKEVRVHPNGKQVNLSLSDRLEANQPVSQTVFLPAEAIPGTQKLLVKIYPGLLSQVVEGLDSILRMPNGCFEQTSSTTYPNVLVLDYLRATNQVAPEAEMKAEEYINLGYQRLTTFEVAGGGFSLFGDAPADRMLTAYGLQEFSDMAAVYDVDPNFIARAAHWLLDQQASDGSWENDRGLVHESTWSSLGDDRLPVTAYITWSLIDAGFYDEGNTQKGLEYIRERQSQAEDAYVLALVANALVAGDLREGQGLSAPTEAALDRLAGMAQVDGSSASWQSGVATFMGSQGKTNSIETTALAALAFLRSGTHADQANAALTGLIREKDSFGTWYSTQATVLTLKAMIESARAGAEDVDASVTLTLNGGQTRSLEVNRENYDVVQLVSFDDVNLGRDNVVELSMEGKGSLMYQIAGSYYLPWDDLARYPELIPAQDLVSIDVAYDRSELSVNDTVEVTVRVALNEPGARSESAIIDLGLPPGFTVEAEDLAALVAYYNDVPQDYPFAQIQRYELTGRQIILYLTNLSEGKPLEFSYRLRAKYPLRAQVPATSAYDYYNPELSGEQAPQILVVN